MYYLEGNTEQISIYPNTQTGPKNCLPKIEQIIFCQEAYVNLIINWLALFPAQPSMVHVWFDMCCVEPSSRCGGYPRSQQSDTTQIVNTTVIPLISIKSHSSNHRRDLCKLFQMTFQLCYSQYLFLLSTSTVYNNPYLDIRQIHLKVSTVISPVTPPSCRWIP